MPRGGARANSGPPPDPNALRRERPSDKETWRTLPAEGRQGDPPAWPLLADLKLMAALQAAEDQRIVVSALLEGGEAPKGTAAKLAKLDQQVAELTTRIRLSEEREAVLWDTLWHTPQAVAWDDLQYTREVALYVRLQIAAEFGDLDAGKESRQWSNLLGLNPNALLRNRWRIVPAVAAAPATTPTTRKSTRSTKARALKLIDGGAA